MKIKILIFLFALSSVTLFAQQSDPNKKEDFSDDWAALSKYKRENELLAPTAKGEKRVVFLGSSIFEFWKQKDPEYFKRNPYIDRGISGQISPQLLIRFRQDVINLKPKAVIILAGSNDLAGNKGHVSNETVLNNIKSMAELAKKNHIKVILCKYLPIYEYPWNKNLKGVADQIISLNDEIVAYAKANHFTILDYWTPLVDERNGQKAEYTEDGVHPNFAGYKVMETVTEQAIDKILRRRK
ncbi:GDSL-type esterase/lipase family protein [Pedobacter sp. MC2016-05]|uniref:GDSL-type esterase/lipase family protein n=1 Tax=Pedobacter sp. MC2016-05 TaxID=2994474 RepID=UPI002247CA84|nr:GDSL-type esterase/lipase family protein [Pedobacter sp. MC2016-05]MCX2476428.1 GDSL-type esterase/lipase family protein [Pedobacter sp. MC2016-05]